jgi:SH3 domain-containing protein
MRDSAEQDQLSEGGSDHAVAAQGQQGNQRPPAAVAQTMLSRGQRNPQDFAALLQANPAAQREILALLNSTVGMAFAQAVVSLVSGPQEAPQAGAATNAEATTGAKTAGVPLGPVRVTADGLNVRRTPNAQASDNIVGGLHHGAVVTAVAHQDAWVAIDFRGATAYVHGDYVEAAPKPNAAAGTPHGPAAGGAKPDAQSVTTHAPAGNTPEPAPTPAPTAHHETAPVAPIKHETAPVAPIKHETAPVAPTPVADRPAVPVAAHDTPQPVAPATTAKLEDPALLALAAKVHDPHLDTLLSHIASVLALDTKLRATRSIDTYYEDAGAGREDLVHEIGMVRGGLGALTASGPDVDAFKVAVNHKLEEVAPYHFQLNIKSIESVGGWSTCNLTSLAMALEVIGIGPSSYPSHFHDKLLAVAKIFHKDIAGDKDSKNPGARLASHGRDASKLTSLMGLRFPDFLQLAAVVHKLGAKEATDENIIAAANQAVMDKPHISFLAELSRDFGASPASQAVKWDADAKKNHTANSKLEDFGEENRGDHGSNRRVEAMNTAKNLMERETNPAKKAALQKDYEALLAKEKPALEGKGIESTLSLDTYQAAVTRDLGPSLDAGAGVIAGLSGHWTRLYAIDEQGVKVQDPGQWNRSEMKISWAEARAMGYFWTNLVIR